MLQLPLGAAIMVLVAPALARCVNRFYDGPPRGRHVLLDLSLAVYRVWSSSDCRRTVWRPAAAYVPEWVRRSGGRRHARCVRGLGSGGMLPCGTMAGLGCSI